MKRFRKWFLILIVVWVCFGVAVALVRLARGEGKFFYQARFTKFLIFEGPDPSTGLPQEPVTVLPTTVERIYACGYLEASGKVPLHFLLFYKGRSTRWLDPVEYYQSGWEFKELPQSWREPGQYRAEVWLQRHEVASTPFGIVP